MHDEAGFLALEEFLDDDLVAGIAEAPRSMDSAAATASCAVCAMITPLPAARPLALTTIGACCAPASRGRNLRA